jgi:hypothetical protein
VYTGPKTPRGTNKNSNRVPDLLMKVFPKALATWQDQPWQEGLGTGQDTNVDLLSYQILVVQYHMVEYK